MLGTTDHLSRSTYMKTLLVLVALASLVPATALGCPSCEKRNAEHAHAKANTAGAPHAAAAAPLAPNESRVMIPVSGMHCSFCVSRVKAALTKMDGVKAVDADLDKGQAVVSFEKGKADTSKMVRAIDALGFKAGTPIPN
jgi:copper chaperone CopZ